MRKFLMLGAAILGASGSLALAQAPTNPSQGQAATRYGAGPAPNNNNAWGTANTPSGSIAAGPLSTEYAPYTYAAPAPGTIVIHLNGRVEADVVAEWSPANTGIGPSGAGYKINPVGIASYFRLYPGFDGQAANGLRYGASVELRENFYGSTTSAGVNSSPSANTTAETIYVRRAFTYLAMDQIGILRLGQGDGVLGLFDNCIFTSQCWDAGLAAFNGGSGVQGVAPSSTTIPFVCTAARIPLQPQRYQYLTWFS